MRIVIAATTALVLVLSSVYAHAFCGFYVSGSNKKMFADATQVVLMRSGTRTILSMQNDYRGPLEDFAMVVPVPVVLKDTDVRVLNKGVFDRIDSLGSPRLVEYWEQDPCPKPRPKYDDDDMVMFNKKAPSRMAERASSAPSSAAPSPAPAERMIAPILASFAADPPVLTADVDTQVTWTFAYANAPYPEPQCTVDGGVGRITDGATTQLKLAASTTYTLTCANTAGKSVKQIKINVVKVEAKFDVAEYQIVILSATESTGLDQWLTLNKYKIPSGAEPLLRPYVEGGSKFFVARVDPKKVQMVDGRAVLSPLRVQYDSEEFTLPIRLGLANSSGKQDLIVNILSPDKRYEVSNYKNVFIPTNIDLKPTVKERFAEFYAALFDKTLQANPGAVVTEYAWTARSMARGGGRGGRGPLGVKCDPCPTVIPLDGDMMLLGADVVGGPIQKGAYVLTRLHARYGPKDMKDDLRFKEAKAVAGGREVRGEKGLETGAEPSGENFFQARYAIRYPWTGAIKCKNPQRGVWGGPPGGGVNQLIAASNTAYAPRGKLQIATVIKRNLWEIGVKMFVPKPKPPATPAPPKTP